MTTLDCVLLKDSNRAPVARLGPKINSRAEECCNFDLSLTSELDGGG